MKSLQESLLKEKEESMKSLESANKKQLSQSNKSTKIVICLTNKVREILARKLEQATLEMEQSQNQIASLKEDLSDMTNQNSKNIMEIKEQHEQEMKDKTSQIIAEQERAMKAFEEQMKADFAASDVTKNQSQEERFTAMRQDLEKEKFETLQSSKLEFES